MLYCVKCGDPIEKDELICDKCGYHFSIIEGSPAKVYMDKIPTAQSLGQSGQPGINGNFQGQRMQPQSRPVQGQPMSGAGMQRPVQGQPMSGAEMQRPVQGQPMSGAGMQRAVQGQPMSGAGMQRPIQVQPKKKKKKNGLLITACVMGGLLFVGCFCVFISIGAFFLTDTLLSEPEEDIIVNNYSDDNVNTEPVDTVVYDSSRIEDEVDNAYIEGAIRDPFVTLKGNGEDTVTIMIYMNGADLESDAGMASQDIREILKATLSDNVNVVIQTGGTRKWSTEAIASDHSQRFLVENGALTLVDDSLGQLDITDPQTLEDFIVFCKTNYPANRNMLILWNHGAGPVYGFGYDEHVDDYNAALTLDEIQDAIANAGIRFEMIGFDACLMGGLETACALYDCADYLIASEDFESGRGWEYQNWLTILGTNSSTSMEDLSKVIIDDFVKESLGYGSDGILAMVDLRYTKLLFQAWCEFAYAAQDDLLACNYSMEMTRTDRMPRFFETPMERLMRDPWEAIFDNGGNENILQDYNYAVDIMALADTLDTEEAKALEAAVSMALVYCSATSGDSEMTGLSVTLPYDSNRVYSEMEKVYTNCGFDTEYIAFLEAFVDAEVQEDYDWGQSEWGGWDTYEEEEYDWEDYDWEEYEETDFGWEEFDAEWENFY